MTSMRCNLEPAIWSHDTGQQISYFDRCQLIITCSISKKYTVNQGCMSLSGAHYPVSVNLLLEFGRHVARLHCRRRRRRVYAPTSNTASHGTPEKINSWVPFSSLIWVWGSAWRPSAAGAPLLLEYGRHVARLHRRRRRRRRAYAPTSNTASHGTHEKINSWVPFSSLIWVWGSALRPSAAGAPLIIITTTTIFLNNNNKTLLKTHRKTYTIISIGLKLSSGFSKKIQNFFLKC